MTNEEIFKFILSHFTVKKIVNGEARCICPGHKDDKPSLHISMGDKKIILDCKANCSYRDILTAVGLKPEQLYYDYYNRHGNARRVSKKQYWLEKYSQARYDFYNISTGERTHTKYRIVDRDGKKQFPQGHYDENNVWIDGLNGIDTSLSVFCNGHIKQLQQAIKQGTLICYTEGEKDALTLWKYGYIVFTCGAVRTFKQTMLPYLKDANILVFGDNDNAGRTDAERVARLINTVGKAKVIIPPGVPEKGDITDYMHNHTKEDLRSLVAENLSVTDNRIEGVAKCDTPTEVQELQNKPLEQVLQDLHAEQYETSDKGFGRLFADVFKDKHRYNPSRKDFMKYDGKRWVDDIEGLSARASAKLLSDSLVRYAVSVDTDGKYLKAVAPLCNIRNRNNMLQDSKDVYFFSNEQLDKNDYLLNVQNGTLDLSENEPVFLNHNPDMLLSKICNAEYDPAVDCREWKKFLMEIMQGDKEKITYLQKIAGLSLTGNTEQETCFILYGSTTRNGKSTFCETLIYLLGDYALTMKPESLAVKQNLDSRQASGDIARLAGCRFCNASEPPKRMLFDTALLKSLLGRDSITARHLHQREFSFIPKFKLVINTNYLPTITDDTVFSSGRINVISFDRHFEPQEQDKDLKNRLREKKELSGILNWCIEGLRLYRQQGLKPPQAVQSATETYRTDSDKIGNFINECLNMTGRNSKAKDIYEAYTKWCEDNGYGCENKSNFFAELKTKGLFANSGTVEGKTAKNIVKGYTLDTDFVECDKQEALPFD